MAYIWSYMKKYPLTLVGSFLGSIIFVIVNLGLPTILAKIINESLINEDYSSLWQNISWMFVLVIIGLLGNILNVYAGSRITTSVVRDIRNDMYRKFKIIPTKNTKQLCAIINYAYDYRCLCYYAVHRDYC